MGRGAHGAETSDPPKAPPADAVAARSVARLARLVDKALATVELSMAQYRLMAYLSRGGTASSVVADRLEVSRPSITSLVDGMLERGLVARKSDDQDRRRVLVVLTPKGQRMLRKADAAITDQLERIAGHLDADRGRRLVEPLEEWYEAIDRYRAERKR